MNAIQRELRVLRAAVAFFTRLPVPGVVTREDLAGAARYFPFAGIVVGASGALVWWLAQLILPDPIAVMLSMAATVILTGAFHEDAIADVCDGFGGGYEKAQVLAIMKDSRVGAFGAIGAALMLGLKAVTLMHVPAAAMVAALVAGHALSRWAAVTLLATQDYVRDDASSKSKDLATRLSAPALLVATVLGVAPLLVLLPAMFWWALPVVLVARWVLGRWFLRRIGGYTGDCLGATQQVCEVAFYLTVVAVASR